ncbi:hypothetical protein VTJ49DRAFT_4329 [Mycothermus thermophilus]|uniref:Coenzyme Q-binding protein COQ10 START domain-containing protein n=1 Tax=Humicola insolens TaxID=85995 RepID=A0ABR3V5Z3_HUMIN
MSDANSSTQASSGPSIPTPTYGPGGTLSFATVCTIRIRATPRECLDAVLDSSSYPKWNRFCRACTIDAQPDNDGGHEPTLLRVGTHFTFDVHMTLGADEPVLPPPPTATTTTGQDQAAGGGQPIALEVSVLSPISEEEEQGRKGWRVAWRQRPGAVAPEWMLRSERVHEFVEVVVDSATGEVQTEYRCWETFYGPLAPVVRLTVGGKLEKAFEVWSKGLKWWVEEGGKGR